MAYEVEQLVDGVRREENTNGTGTGKLYVKNKFSVDGVVDIAEIACEGPPTNPATDTYGQNSEWHDLTNGKKYYKTSPTAWTVMGSVT